MRLHWRNSRHRWRGIVWAMGRTCDKQPMMGMQSSTITVRGSTGENPCPRHNRFPRSPEGARGRGERRRRRSGHNSRPCCDTVDKVGIAPTPCCQSVLPKSGGHSAPQTWHWSQSTAIRAAARTSVSHLATRGT